MDDWPINTWTCICAYLLNVPQPPIIKQQLINQQMGGVIAQLSSNKLYASTKTEIGQHKLRKATQNRNASYLNQPMVANRQLVD